jgi:hypothetical protein
LRLGHADDYGIGDETGTWRVCSNVGRASLMLRPADGGDEYGYLITREPDQQVGLNGEPYEVRPDS